MKKDFSHLNEKDRPAMVDVSEKSVTHRTAIAQSKVRLTPEILASMEGKDISTKKGPVFQTAIIAGIMGVKKTSELIPLCHPLSISKCDIDISMKDDCLVDIRCTVRVEGKTGVEMEALTGASVAALTIYDMCKAFTHELEILETKLIHKSGGKSEFNRSTS